MDLSEEKAKILEQIDETVTEVKINKLELEIDILRDELLKLVSKTEIAFDRLKKQVNKLSEYKDTHEHNKQMRLILERIEKLEKSDKEELSLDNINSNIEQYISSLSNVVDTDRKKIPEPPLESFADSNEEIWERMSKMPR